MNIRAITVDRGIATLVHQAHLPTFLSFSRAGASSVEAISSRTGVPAAGQEETELEGGYSDDEGDEGPWRLERDEDDEHEVIRQEDSRMSTRADDVERAVV